MGKLLRIDVWSDIACPWCYVGKRRLEAALSQFPHSVEIVWRAFELDPSAPRERDASISYAQRLANKYGTSLSDAETMIHRMTDVARADGLSFHFERIRPGNTFDAHRVIHLAASRGLQDAVKERLLLGYMTEGESVGDLETLVRLGSEAGLNAGEVRATLASDAFEREVRADEAEAHRLDIRGVPFFLLGGRFAIAGAQPAELILRGLTQAWSALDTPPVNLDEGATCGPEGCR